MNVRFMDDANVIISYNPFDHKTRKKQEIADYLMGKHDQGRIIYNGNINERDLLMSYLPFIHAICFKDPDVELKKNEIKLQFKLSTLMSPSHVILEVSPDLYYFLHG